MKPNKKSICLSIIFILISIFILFNDVFAYIADRPLRMKEFNESNKIEYGWITQYPIGKFEIIINETGLNFISKDEIRKYVKLKLRGFIKDYKIIKPKSDDNNYNWMNIAL